MKIFYSELVENPAFYSFGYSIYGMPEQGDSMDELYERGFLPCVVAREQPEQLMYQARGVRVRVQEFARTSDQRRAARKAEALGNLELLVHPIKELANDDSFLHFLLDYFKFRFGPHAMPKERLTALLHSGWVTHVAECRVDGVTAGYMLEHHAQSFVHVLYQAYAKKYENSNLGIHFYATLMERARAEGKKHVYFGATYGLWMRYKINFSPVEYWDGTHWISDPNSERLKKLLSEGVSLVPYADRWRAQRSPFYFADGLPLVSREAKFISMLFDAAPHTAMLVFVLPALMLAFAFFTLLFR